MEFPGRWWHKPNPQDGEMGMCVMVLIFFYVFLILLELITLAFWLSWISLVCTIIAAIGGLVGFGVSYKQPWMFRIPSMICLESHRSLLASNTRKRIPHFS